MSAEHIGPQRVHAYVLVKVEPGKAAGIVARLRERIPDAAVHRVEGGYDIVVDVEAEAAEYVSAMARDQIRVIPAVTAHDVLIVTD